MATRHFPIDASRNSARALDAARMLLGNPCSGGYESVVETEGKRLPIRWEPPV